MKTKNIIWGLVLVLIGVLFILKNLGVIYFSWYGIWRLWPLVLVLIGIAIIPVKSGIKVALTIITLVIATLILTMSPGFRSNNDFSWFDWRRDNGRSPEATDIGQQIAEKYDTTITSAELTFDAAAGNFKINESTGELFEFTREGNIGKYNYSIKDLGNRREITIGLQEGHFRNVDMKNKVTMKLNPTPLWDLKVDVGAASLDLDLSAFKINKLDINGGASSINVKVGSLQKDCRIKIDSGASSIKIEVPQSFACQVKTSTILSSKDLSGFNKVADGTYVTENFSGSANNIVIELDAAVSSLDVERY